MTTSLANLRKIKVFSVKNQAQLADKCSVAESYLSRLKGLIGVKELPEGEGLLLSPCRDIHMWFMNIPIDVVFLNSRVSREGKTFFRVSSCRENLRPWALLPNGDWGATDTLELPVGTIQRCQIEAGDEICIS